jgi:hypothetical protein
MEEFINPVLHVKFSEYEIKDARDLYLAEIDEAVRKGLVPYWRDKNGWVGILGEQAVEKELPHLQKTTSAFKVVHHDFLTAEGKKVDVKAHTSKKRIKPYFFMTLNEDQIQANERRGIGYDIIIPVFYCLPDQMASIPGWIEWEYFIEYSMLKVRGEKFSSFGPAVVKKDCRMMPIAEMNNIKNLW